MMEFIMVYGFIAMIMVFVVGNIAIVESNNPVVVTKSTETGFILVDDMDVNMVGVDFGKLRQR